MKIYLQRVQDTFYILPNLIAKLFIGGIIYTIEIHRQVVGYGWSLRCMMDECEIDFREQLCCIIANNPN